MFKGSYLFQGPSFWGPPAITFRECNIQDMQAWHILGDRPIRKDRLSTTFFQGLLLLNFQGVGCDQLPIYKATL